MFYNQADMKKFLILIVLTLLLHNCETINKKVDKATKIEEAKLSKFLEKSESELKVEWGKPDLIEKRDNQNSVLVYYDSKFKIKCERRFEINPRGVVIGFSSKNCF